MNKFNEIDNLIDIYNKAILKLSEYQYELATILEELKQTRKDGGSGVNNQILQLNNRRVFLKEEISSLKKQANSCYTNAENLIFAGLNDKFDFCYQKYFSKLYNKQITLIYKDVGDSFDDETCLVNECVVTHNKTQNGLILKTVNYGIKDDTNNIITKKAVVDICVYLKKKPLGEVVEFNKDLI